MYIDFKQTHWERVFIPKESNSIILKAIKDGNINCPDDIYGFTKPDSFENLLYTNEQMTPEENNNNATIELFENKGDILPILSNQEIKGFKIGQSVYWTDPNEGRRSGKYIILELYPKYCFLKQINTNATTEAYYNELK